MRGKVVPLARLKYGAGATLTADGIGDDADLPDDPGPPASPGRMRTRGPLHSPRSGPLFIRRWPVHPGWRAHRPPRPQADGPALAPRRGVIVGRVSILSDELPTVPGRLIGAACTLDAPQLRERLREWRALRDAAGAIEPIVGGARLVLSADEPMGAVADLVARESECCSFYTFTLRIDGPTRQLEISAGPGGEAAVRGLLRLDH